MAQMLGSHLRVLLRVASCQSTSGIGARYDLSSRLSASKGGEDNRNV